MNKTKKLNTTAIITTTTTMKTKST